jgi:hypothetical protein
MSSQRANLPPDGRTTPPSMAGNLIARDAHYTRNAYFEHLVLFLALFFAPSGMYLLWRFPRTLCAHARTQTPTGLTHGTRVCTPDWETMFFYTSHASLDALLVTAFAASNVLLGVLGFKAAHYALRIGRVDTAHTLWVSAYAIMFGILGLGYRRFLYPGCAATAARISWASLTVSDVRETGRRPSGRPARSMP